MESHLQRKKLNSIHFFRGIAAMLVVVYHYSLSASAFLGAPAFNNFFQFGGEAGVSFFFVLSGFIIFYVHRTHLGKPQRATLYILKRCIRIYPTYIPVLIIVTVLYLIFGLSKTNTITQPISLEYFIKSLLLIEYEHYPILNVAWTLVHEMSFYIMFVLLIFNKKIGSCVFVAWGSCILFFSLTHFGQSLGPLLSFIFDFYNLLFMMGILTAIYVSKSDSGGVINQLPLLVIGIIGFIVTGINTDYHFIHISSNLTLFLYGTCSVLTIAGGVHDEKRKRRIYPEFAIFLGSISYSLYLVHYIIVSITLRVYQKFSLLFNLDGSIIADTGMIATLLVSILVAALYYKKYERPILNFLHKKIKNRAIQSERTAVKQLKSYPDT